MRANRLRDFITIQKLIQQQDDKAGALVERWADIATDPVVPADIVHLSVRDFIAAGAEQSEVAARVTIRYRSDVDAANRLIHDGKAYRIIGVMPDPKSGREYLTLAVASGVRIT